MNSGIDKPCIFLCEAMNRFEGIETTESCCGHGEKPYRIWFNAKDLDALPPLLYYFDGCHSGSYGWRVIARTDCSMAPANFMVEGPIGEKAYQESEKIAKLMIDYLKRR